MRKLFGITLGGLQNKMILLVLTMVLATVAAFAAISLYQNSVLVEIVGEARNEQQDAISQTSKETMHQIMAETLVKTTTLQAGIADNEFSEVVGDVRILTTMAQGTLRTGTAFLRRPSASRILPWRAVLPLWRFLKRG